MEEGTGYDKESVFSEKVKAGARTYFFDVKATWSNDYYITITESKKKQGEQGEFIYEKHKIFLYKENFDKFIKALGITVSHVKTKLLPNADFDQYA